VTHRHALQLAHDGLVLGIVGSQVGEDSGRAGDDGEVVAREKHDELAQEDT